MDIQSIIVCTLLVGVLVLLAVGVIWTIKITRSLPTELDSVFYEHEKIQRKS